MIITNGKIYALCGKCGSLVRLNKPLLGSLHICDEDSKLEHHEKMKRAQLGSNPFDIIDELQKARQF